MPHFHALWVDHIYLRDRVLAIIIVMRILVVVTALDHAVALQVVDLYAVF